MFYASLRRVFSDILCPQEHCTHGGFPASQGLFIVEFIAQLKKVPVKSDPVFFFDPRVGTCCRPLTVSSVFATSSTQE